MIDTRNLSEVHIPSEHSLGVSHRQELEGLFLDNLHLIDRIIASLCHRHHLRAEDANDFASWTKLRLIEDDYAVFRKFRGESAVGTYLTVVVAMLMRDYRVRRWGRWRASAVARRMGPLAVRLETLVTRDGFRLDQAAELLRTSGDTSLSDAELGKLLHDLPQRAQLRAVEVGEEPLADVPASAHADDLLLVTESEAERLSTDAALSQALEHLAAEDRLVLRMRFWDNMSVADISRGLGLPQKPLYRRIDRALTDLREHLEAAGISQLEAQTMLNEITL